MIYTASWGFRADRRGRSPVATQLSLRGLGCSCAGMVVDAFDVADRSAAGGNPRTARALASGAPFFDRAIFDVLRARGSRRRRIGVCALYTTLESFPRIV